MHGYDRLAFVALDDDMGALLSQLDAAALPKKPEQILAGQTFLKSRFSGACVKSIDRFEAVTPVTGSRTSAFPQQRDQWQFASTPEAGAEAPPRRSSQRLGA